MAIFQFASQRKAICIFVITSTGYFTYLSDGNSFTVESGSSAANKQLLSIVSHISYYFARGVNPFHLPCYDLWWIRYWKLIMKADSANNLNRNALYLTRGCDKKFLAFFTPSASPFAKWLSITQLKLCRVSISGIFSSRRVLLLLDQNLSIHAELIYAFYALRLSAHKSIWYVWLT